MKKEINRIDRIKDKAEGGMRNEEEIQQCSFFTSSLCTPPSALLSPAHPV
jgi:hypothetical protein